MSLANSDHPEHYLIGYIEATLRDRTMKPAEKVKACVAKIQEYDADQKRRLDEYQARQRQP
jgi:hypothetical protein